MIFVVAKGRVQVLKDINDQGHQVANTLLAIDIHHGLELLINALSKGLGGKERERGGGGREKKEREREERKRERERERERENNTVLNSLLPGM